MKIKILPCISNLNIKIPCVSNIAKSVTEWFWQRLGDHYFYKVWLGRKQESGMYAYFACIDAKQGRMSGKQAIKTIRAELRRK